ncbi:unnamed protein product [Polarella glacialis]|uniref:Uncharacterized protein n=1 Tax=Polarella glacialis TaxID=89957 RepID=A0A813IMX8_POLGL|nr:unnamed protein product [Polarella glacialis]
MSSTLRDRVSLVVAAAMVTTTLAATMAPKAAAAPKILVMSGACDYRGSLNGMTFELQGTTADGEPYYKGNDMRFEPYYENYIYHDADCDGSGSAPRWVLDGDNPSSGGFGGCCEDVGCNYDARLDAKSPVGPATWRMYCGSELSGLGWQDVNLTLSEANNTATSMAVGHGSVAVTIAATIFVGAM